MMKRGCRNVGLLVEKLICVRSASNTRRHQWPNVLHILLDLVARQLEICDVIDHDGLLVEWAVKM